MITKIKANKILPLALFFVCIIFIISPKTYSTSCLTAVSVWAINVLPTLLPFFIITRLIVGLITPKPNIADKLFNKLYNTPAITATIYVLSIISGYPMGAKLICDVHEKGYINKKDAERMFAFCSVSGPMFIVGTVGVSIMSSYKVGLIILIANIISSLINGLIYRGKKTILDDKNIILEQKDNNLLQNSVYDALISILMVGAYIVLSFLLIDLLKNLGVLNFLSSCICHIFKNFNNSTVEACLAGIIEITRGCLDLSSCNVSMIIKTIIASGLIGFGGISVMLQSVSFLSKLKIKVSKMLLQKFTQGILCVVFTVPIALIFL